MRHLYILLAYLFILPSAVKAQTDYEYVQLNAGRLLPTDRVRVYVEYPEFLELTKNEVRRLKESGFKAEKDFQLHVGKAVSRGETLLDITFVPVVERNGHWLRAIKYEVRHAIEGTKMSPAFRNAAQKAQQLSAASRYAEHSVLSQGKWVKIRMKDEGIYQLTHEQLKRMGFDDPARVKLYGYGGKLLPEVLAFEGKDALTDDLNEVPLYRRNGSMLFFAEGLTTWSENATFHRNTFSDYSYYFLTEGENPATFTTAEHPAGQPETISQVQAIALTDNDEFVWYGGGRDFYDSRDTREGMNYRLAFPGIVPGDYTVRYDVSARSSVANTKLTIGMPGQSDLVSATINRYGEGESARGRRGSFKARLSNEAERFNVTTNYTGRLNYLSCVYTQKLSTLSTASAFTTEKSGAVTLQVADANTGTRVWQLGNAQENVAELNGNLNGNTYSAYAADGSRRFIVMDITKTYASPEVVGKVENQDLHADRAIDYVIIVPASGKLTAQAERLADAHRKRSGMRVKVVRADLLFNEFSSGTPDATAYRRYMKMLYDRAATDDDKPKYLLLFGDCSFDNRMVTAEWKGQDPDNFLLAYERNDLENFDIANYSIGTMESYVTDDYFGFLDDGEGQDLRTEKVDLGIGRFLCHTEDKAKWLVDRTIDYLDNKNAGIWKNKMWSIGDAGDENLHMKDALEVARQVRKSANGSFLLRHIFPDSYNVTLEAKGVTFPEATRKLKTSMQQGALIFNYNGHGSPDRLSHQFLLTKEEMTQNVSKAAPLWLFASCEISPYDQIVEDLGRNALFCPQGAAVAVICASRSVYANYNRSMNMGIVEFAFDKDKKGNRYTLGDALRLTKCELIKNTGDIIGTDQTKNKLKYVLLGDPALALSYADEGITIDSINGKPLTPTSFTELPVGRVVRFSGYVNADTKAGMPDAAYQGTLTGAVYTPKQNITCKGYGNTRTDPQTYSDYSQMLFEGSVKIKDGRFSLEMMIPRGISFSKESALLSLYAVNEDATSELNGHYDRFCLYGTEESATPDTLGPDIYLYLETPDFIDGGTIANNPTFYASIADSSAISILTGNLGHDMELWIDDDKSTTKVVSDYFAFEYGSYSKGLVEYPIGNLTEGRHKLTFRAWDVYDNATTQSLHFVITNTPNPGIDVTSTEAAPSRSTRFITSHPALETATTVTTEVYNVYGMRVWHHTETAPPGAKYVAMDWTLDNYAGSRLTKGIYLYRSKVGGKETKTKKLIIH